MDKSELLDQLYTALGAVERCYPYFQDWTKAKSDHEKMKDNKSFLLGFSIVIEIIVFGSIFLAGWLSEDVGDNIIWLVIIAIPGLIVLPSYPMTCAAIPRYRRKEEQALEALDRKMSEEQEGLDLYRRLMPEACIDPRYAHIFIGYLESGRADSAKEAWSLFEEMLHREKMEQLAQKQLALTQQMRSQLDLIAAENMALSQQMRNRRY